MSEAKTRRRGGRSSSRQKAEETRFAQAPFRQPRMLYEPTRVISDDEVEAIHLASLEVLETVGMDFIHPKAKAILKAAGADVDPDSDQIRIDRAIILDALKTVPSSFTMHARNPAHNLTFGANYMSFIQTASPPNCTDIIGGRRAGNSQDYRNFVKLAQMFNVIHLTGGYPVEPVDIHPSVRHLDCLYDLATLTDKVFHVYSLGADRNRDALEMMRIVRGIDDVHMDNEPSLFSIINASSPLRYDTPMLEGIMEMSARNQCVVITPFTLAGAMAPVTIAGALVQQNAEALAGVAFTQLVRPGAPVVYGGFTSNVDMKSGAPAFGTPEYMKAVLAGGQLARRYNIPYRTSNVCAANSADAQAAYETSFSLWSVVMGGGNLVMHSAGWLEGGLTMSYEKMMIDVDMLQMVSEFMKPLSVTDETLALDTIREVGPGGHFFGTDHTQARFRDAFYSPLISDWRNFESWQEAGAPTAIEAANRLYQELLAIYEPPTLEPSRLEELDAFVAKRKEAGGVATDF